jgi:hypothetical protein
MTAVDWLVEELKGVYESDYLNKLVQKAKEMERQQIIEAHGNKQKIKSNPDSIVTYGYTYTGEMYYNDKFKNKNNE